jgi:3-oxoacyl-[acyl-carrier-protein] synthase-3
MAARERSARITSLGMYVPPDIMTNADFEKLVDTSDEWIVQMTGMRERHYIGEGEATSDLATRAAKEALERAGIAAEEVQMILVATATPDMHFPSTACLTQHNIGAKNAFAFDISAGCSGFVYGTVIASQFIRAGTVDTALVIGAESLTRFTNMTDRSSCILFGDGAGAAVFQACEPGRGLVDHYIQSDGKLADLLRCPAGGSKSPASHATVDANEHTIHMIGNKVYVNAVRAMSDSVMKVLEQQGLTGDDLDILFPHQANIRIIKSVAERAGLPMDKVYVNIHKYGNTSAASIPLAMYEAVEDGSLKEGMLAGTVAFGAGFTWGSTLMRW